MFAMSLIHRQHDGYMEGCYHGLIQGIMFEVSHDTRQPDKHYNPVFPE